MNIYEEYLNLPNEKITYKTVRELSYDCFKYKLIASGVYLLPLILDIGLITVSINITALHFFAFLFLAIFIIYNKKNYEKYTGRDFRRNDSIIKHYYFKKDLIPSNNLSISNQILLVNMALFLNSDNSNESKDYFKFLVTLHTVDSMEKFVIDSLEDTDNKESLFYLKDYYDKNMKEKSKNNIKTIPNW